MRFCTIPGCDRKHEARGLCRLHYKRLRSTGDPLKASRFDSVEEKDAYVAAKRAERRRRGEVTRRVAKARKDWQALTKTRATNKIRPEAKAMVEALDGLSETERAIVVSAAMEALFGRPIDINVHLAPEDLEGQPQ